MVTEVEAYFSKTQLFKKSATDLLPRSRLLISINRWFLVQFLKYAFVGVFK